MPNDGLSDIISHSAKGTIDRILNDIYEPVAAELSALSIEAKEGFVAYSRHNLERCMNIRTLDSPQTEKALSDFYVSSTFRWGSSDSSDADLVREIASGLRLIVSGKGGSGKSIFLKYLFLSLITKEGGGLPLFVELRRINTGKYGSVISLCRESLHLIDGLSDRVFRNLCNKGFFTFIFDGFDEVLRAKRNDVEMELLEIARKFPRCGFVVAGRENTKFHSWEGFRKYKIKDLELGEVIQIVEKSSFEHKLKEKIKRDLRHEDFFDSNQSLLATPLLVTMLLLTYKRTSRLPKLLTNFYPQVFETLVYLHDSSKETFAREYTMGAEQFGRFFSVFCLISYLKEKYEFSEAGLTEIVQKTVSYGSRMDVLSGIEKASIEGLKSDLWEASNLLIFDDGQYCFIHRSMQEFFAAESLSAIAPSKAHDILKAFSLRTGDSAFKFAFELSEASVVDNFLLPQKEQLLPGVSFEKFDNSEFLTRLEMDFDVSIPPYMAGSSNCEIRIGNEPLYELLSAVDLISGVETGIQDLLSRVRSIIEGARLRLPLNVDVPAGSFARFSFDAEGHVVLDVDNSNLCDVPNGVKTKIIDRVIRLIQSHYDRVVDPYFGATKQKLAELEVARAFKNRSIDDILGL